MAEHLTQAERAERDAAVSSATARATRHSPNECAYCLAYLMSQEADAAEVMRIREVLDAELDARPTTPATLAAFLANTLERASTAAPRPEVYRDAVRQMADAYGGTHPTLERDLEARP